MSHREQAGRLSLAGGVRWHRGALEMRAVAGRSALILRRLPERTVDFAFELRRHIGSARVALSSRGTRWEETQSAEMDTVYFVAGFPFTGTTTRVMNAARSYVDTEASAEWWVGFAQLQGRAGLRGFSESTLAARWAAVRLLAPVTTRLAIVAEARHDPGSPEQGLRARRVASLGVHMTSATLRRPARGGDDRARASREDMRVAVSVDPDGGRALVLHGLAGRKVEITGTLTNWTPLPLQPHGPNAWRTAFRISPGVHHLLVRIDDGDWQVPPALPTARHEFGTVAVLFINE